MLNNDQSHITNGKLNEKYTDLFYNAPVGYLILDNHFKRLRM
jgi:hypothetical protein